MLYENPKMDGENNGSKPYEQMGWFGGVFDHPYFWFNTHITGDWDVHPRPSTKRGPHLEELAEVGPGWPHKTTGGGPFGRISWW